MTRRDLLKLKWAANAPTGEDELASARETALLHAKACDEMRRDLARANRKIEALNDQITRQELAIGLMVDCWVRDRNA